MSPTVLREKGYRFFFFSREEERIHIHIFCGDGEAKVWLEPQVELAKQYGLSDKQVVEILEIVQRNKDVIRDKWRQHFNS